MVKVVLKLSLEDETKRRKAFKTAAGMDGVTSTSLESGDKMVVVGEGIDPIALTTMLRKRLGYAELLSVSAGDDKNKTKEGKVEASESKVAQPVVFPNYQYHYNAVPAYSYPAYYPYHHQEAAQDPAGCSIM